MKTFKTLLIIVLLHPAFAQRTSEFAKVDSIIQHFNKPNAPGFSIGIIENGKLVYSKGVGLSDIDKQIPNSNNSIFGIASIAKQFTAACIWSLIQEGKIHLDDDIRTYIPEFPSYGEGIRIRHMLNHTSGIRNYHAIMELSGFDYDKEFHDNQTILHLACKQKELNNKPGEKVIYGNTSYTLLAIIIERITEKNLDQYAKEKLFIPLGMKHTFYRVDTTTFISDKVSGYIQNENGDYIHVSNNQISYGAGSLNSSIADLAIWSNVLNGLDSTFIDLKNFLTTTEILSSGEIPKYARGVMVDEYKEVKTIHHSGYGLGGRSQIIAIPELKLAIIVLTNLESINPITISYTILDLFLPDQDKKSAKSPVTFRHKKKDLNAFSGQYKEQNSDMKMEFFLENGTLKALNNQGKAPILLTAISKGKFTRLNNPSVSYEFTTKNNTKADLIVYFGGTPFYFSRATFIDPLTVNLSDYIGKYHSTELSVDYEIYIQDGNLSVDYPHHTKTKLMAGQKDEFGNGQRVLYRFVRNKDGKVVTFYLSAEGTVKNIEFNKK